MHSRAPVSRAPRKPIHLTFPHSWEWNSAIPGENGNGAMTVNVPQSLVLVVTNILKVSRATNMGFVGNLLLFVAVKEFCKSIKN